MSKDEAEKAKPGWYTDTRWPGEHRRWDGAEWLNHWRPVTKTSPENFMFVGLMLTAVGAVATVAGFAADQALGWVVAGVTGFIAGTVFNIGVIGKGVEIGVRASRH